LYRTNSTLQATSYTLQAKHIEKAILSLLQLKACSMKLAACGSSLQP
jgi:hypothetical protein